MQTIDNVAHLPGPERYRAFIAHIARTKVLWIVESATSTLTLEDSGGRVLLPVWPTRQLAADALTPEETAEGFVAQSRSLEDWLGRSTPALVREAVLVGVFPNAARQCPVVPAARLADDLKACMRGPVLQGTDLMRLRKRPRQKSTTADG
jgi:hypothetical protein